MPTYQFKQVDVFTSRPFFGNPVAVVLGADGLGAEEMQRIAAWTNLSETTFVLEPTVAQPAYRLRISRRCTSCPSPGTRYDRVMPRGPRGGDRGNSGRLGWCRSANAALPAYLVRHGLLERTGREYVATQGTEMGRDGRVYVRVLDGSGRSQIGGQAVTVVKGEIAV